MSVTSTPSAPGGGRRSEPAAAQSSASLTGRQVYRRDLPHPSAGGPPGAPSGVRRHALLAELLERPRGLPRVVDPHPAEDVRRLRELDLAVRDDLDAVAPRVEEAQPARRL